MPASVICMHKVAKKRNVFEIQLKIFKFHDFSTAAINFDE